MHDAEIRVRTKVDTGGFDKFADAMEDTKETLGKVGTSLKSVGTGVKNVFTGGIAFVKAFTKALIASFGKFALIALLVKGLKKALEGLKNSFKEYYKESSTFKGAVDGYKDSVGNLKDSLAQLKNSFISAFAPIIEMVLPYLAKLVDWIAIAVEWITKLIDGLAQLVAYLTGRDTYMRAKKNVGAYNKELDKAIAKNKQLAQFDELNVLRTSGGGGDGASISDLWEEVPLDDTFKKVMDYLKENWRDVVDWAVDYVTHAHVWTNPILPFKFDLTEVNEFFGKINAGLNYIGEAFKNIGEAIKRFVEDVKNAIQSAIDKVKEFFEKVGEIIKGIKDATQSVVNAVKKAFRDWIDMAKGVIKDFSDKIKEAINKIKEFVQGVIDKIKGVINGIKSFFEAINTVINAFFGNLYRVADTCRLIIEMLKEMSVFDLPIIPSWFNPSPAKPTPSPVPKNKMAVGGIVTAPTTALIGEAGREVVLPLESNTEWMDALADRISNTVIFRVENDSDRLLKVVQIKANDYTNRTGKPAFKS